MKYEPQDETRVWTCDDAFVLESGATLSSPQVAYRTWGRLNAAADNAVIVLHALTGSADVDRWWPDLVGTGKTCDPERDFIIAPAALGGCYGSTGPASLRPGSNELWGSAFPAVSVRDMVEIERRLVTALGVKRIALVIGGSLGGMRALEWALMDARVDAVAAIGAPAAHSAWAIAWNHVARLAIASHPESGLAVARAAAMISYRSFASLEHRFGRATGATGAYAVEAWLEQHGARLVDRFDPDAYVTLSRAMDGHDIQRGREAIRKIVRSRKIRAVFVALADDVLYPPKEVRALARLWPASEFALLPTAHGHDGFLIDAARLNDLLVRFRRGASWPGSAPWMF